MIIKGINRVLKENEEGLSYTTEKMYANNILIEEVNVENEEGDLQTDFNLYYYDDLDAKSFQLGSEDLPTPLMAYTMVKEIVNLHDSSSLSEFLEIIKELSNGSMCSSYQSNEENKEQIRERITGYFEEYKRVTSLN